MSTGFIYLHRQIRDHWIWQKSEYVQAWLDILLSANHKANTLLIGNDIIQVKRGSFITSEPKLATRWKWSRTKVRRFLTLLENDEMIIYEKDTKKTTITVCNYDKYQNNKTSELDINGEETTGFDTENICSKSGQIKDRKRTGLNDNNSNIYEEQKTEKEQKKNSKKTGERQEKNTNNNDNNDNNISLLRRGGNFLNGNAFTSLPNNSEALPNIFRKYQELTDRQLDGSLNNFIRELRMTLAKDPETLKPISRKFSDEQLEKALEIMAGNFAFHTRKNYLESLRIVVNGKKQSNKNYYSKSPPAIEPESPQIDDDPDDAVSKLIEEEYKKRKKLK